MKIRNIRNLAFMGIVLVGLLGVGTAWAQSGSPATGTHAEGMSQEMLAARTVALEKGHAFYAVAITMGIACLAAAFAVGKVGAAAFGAAAEKPELLGKAIIFVAIGEGIAILGLIVSLFLLNKI